MTNWNGGSLAVESATSIVNQTIRPTLWVVDNGSIDGSAKAIQEISSEIRMIRNGSNLGYAAGNNQVLRLSTEAEYVLLVNNDVILPDHRSIERIVDYFDSHPEVKGACGRYESPIGVFQSSYNQLPTALVLCTLWGIGRHLPHILKSRRIASYYAYDQDLTKPAKLERPAFSCVLLRQDSIQSVGLMDEQFPIFFNDVDYCWRWREQGWDWLYFPDWRVIHHTSSSTSRMGDFYALELTTSAVRFAKKHFSKLTAALIRLTIVLESAYRKYYHGDIMPASLLAIWKGDFAFLTPVQTAPDSRPALFDHAGPKTQETIEPSM